MARYTFAQVQALAASKGYSLFKMTKEYRLVNTSNEWDYHYRRTLVEVVDLVNSLNNSENESEQQQAQVNNSLGHICWQDDYELFEREGNVYKAHKTNVIMPDGYRCGRYETTRQQWEYYNSKQAQAELDTYVEQQADEVAPEYTVVYDLDNDRELTYNLPAKEALRNAYESIVNKNNNTWEYKPVSEYNYKLVNNRTLIIESSGICCAYSEPTQAPTTELEDEVDTLYVNGWARYKFDYSEQEWAEMLAKDKQAKAECVQKFWDERKHKLSPEVREIVYGDNSEPAPKPQANNTVRFRKPAAPRRVSRRAARFFSMLAA